MAGVTSKKPYKIFNDPIHRSIEMHPYLVRIIDTPEFQRLRYISQLGTVYFVYPGASHNRFEHSIGVAHLAGELVQDLNKRYHPGEDTDLDKKLQEIHEERKDELKTKHKEQLEPQEQQTASSSDHQESELEKEQPVLITKDEGLCVQIAALCHDLGHGPFSHLFDGLFIPKVNEKLTKEDKKDKLERLEGWTHEKQSKIMLEELIKNIKRRQQIRKDKEKDNVEYNEFIRFMTTNLDFIKELIDPPEKKQNPKAFLYEIVSNKRNGIDVDKMDYFARDCYHLGIESNFNCRRFFKFARVCLADDEDGSKEKTMQICMRDKEVGHIYDLYHTRSSIHQKACQHKVVSTIDTMIVDALLLADETLNISDSVLDATKYRTLTDSIYQNILHYKKIESENQKQPDMEKALEILERIESRDLYKCIYDSRLIDVIPGKKTQKSKHERENELERELQKAYKEFVQSKQLLPQQAEKEEFAVKIMKLASGKKGEDPIKHMKFYSKQDPCTAKKLERKEISQLLPNVFSETVLQIISRNSKEIHISALMPTIQKWCMDNDYKLPK